MQEPIEPIYNQIISQRTYILAIEMNLASVAALDTARINSLISRFSASGIGFDLNTRLLGPGFVESTCRAHMRSE